MQDIFLELENCYGINKFKYLISFTKENKAYMIYAPNGTMKTSFANTIKDISLERETRDFIYLSKPNKRILTDGENGKDIDKNNILVIESYSETFKSPNISLLLIEKNIKKEYDEIYSEIEKDFGVLINILKKNSNKKNNIIETITKDFGVNKSEFYTCLENIYDNFSNETSFSNISYSALFTEDLYKILQDPAVANQLKKYIEQYDNLLKSSNIFTPSFNHNNAETIVESLEKNGFFKAKHKVILANNNTIDNREIFSEIINNEKSRILDKGLTEEFQKLDKILSSKAATKTLRDYLFKNQKIIIELSDLENFKKKVWDSYLFNNFDIFKQIIENYKLTKPKLKQIIEIAKEQESEWNKIVKLFNERFSNMPFELQIKNKVDVILNGEIPMISFIYKNMLNEKVEIEENNLISRLSNGEKKALYLLNIIFEIEARKKIGQQTFLVIDDIADSFDYRNKYAIIEYLKDIVNNNIFLPIILTHNFDFYRTVAGRLNIKKTSFFAIKTPSEIKLEKGEYFENVFDTWRGKVYTTNAIFISSISFVRNIVEYIQGRTSSDYDMLTSLLHYKNGSENTNFKTEEILINDLIKVFKNNWGREESKFIQDKQKKVIDIILTEAERINREVTDLIHIENKIVLCIAIRLLAEKYMINRISDSSKTDCITGNQIRKLYELLHFNLLDIEDRKREEIIEKVLIITSENIHINSFMYEPIVDISLEEVKKLYSEVIQYLK